MASFVLETFIDAAPDICFDAIRDVSLQTVVTPSRGVTDRATLGQTIEFEGTHFGFRHRLTVRVVELDRPHLFVDEMIRGPFRKFRHVHEFLRSGDNGTLMRDTVAWTSPTWLLGSLGNAIFVRKYLCDLVRTRNAKLKELVEVR